MAKIGGFGGRIYRETIVNETHLVVMPRFEITPDDFGGFAAKITRPEGSVETANGFATKEAALNWVGERLVVSQEKQPGNRNDKSSDT